MKTTQLVVSLLFTLTTSLFAQTVSSPINGYVTINCPGNSDTRVSAPFSKPIFKGAVQSISGNVLTVQGTPEWTVNEWVYQNGVQPNTYYLQFTGGEKEGRYYTITSNSVNTVSLNLWGENLTDVEPNTSVTIHRYWTLGTLFPPGSPAIHVTTKTNQRKTELVFATKNAAGAYTAPNRLFYFWSGAWRLVNGGTTARNDEIVYPDSNFLIRHSITGNTTALFQGEVSVTNPAIPLYTTTSGALANVVALPVPMSISLDNSGLFESGAFTASSSVNADGDQLQVYDQATVAILKPPAAVYFYHNNAWRKTSAPTVDAGADLAFTPASGVIVMKKATQPAEAVTWTHSVHLPEGGE